MMNKYKGYLNGVNPNYTRKVLQDDDPRYFSIDTGRFVSGDGKEVKTMAEAIAVNDKIDLEYKTAFPPQKAIGAKPIRAAKKQPKETLFQDMFDKKGLRAKPKIESDASVNRRIWKKVEDNRTRGKADYEDFQDHEMMIANSYADTKKLQKTISDNLNEYIKQKIPELVSPRPSVPTPSFMQTKPEPKSLGIADERLLKDLKIKREILDEN